MTRAIASWPTWPGEPGYTATFAEYLAAEFPTSTAADFAVLEAGIVSEETYVEQGLYWSTGPLADARVRRRRPTSPTCCWSACPTTDEFQHQFLGLVSPTLPNGDPNPAYDDVNLDGVKDGRVAEREGYIRAAYHEADQTLALARSLMGKDPTTFVGSDHGFAPQFLAIDASKVLVDLGCCRTRRPPTAGRRRARRSARPRPAGPAAPCRSTSTWPAAIPPARGVTQVPADQEAATVAADQGGLPGADRPERLDPRRPARGLEGHRPRLHQGGGALHPQRAGLDSRHGPPDAHR